MDTWVDHFVMGSDNGSDSRNFEDGIIIFPLYLHLCCTGGEVHVEVEPSVHSWLRNELVSVYCVFWANASSNLEIPGL